MAKKSIAIKPIDILEFVLSDTEKYEAVFNMEALIYYQDIYGAIGKEFDERITKQPYDVGAELLHCGMKVLSPDAELDDAKRIIVGGGISVVNMVIEELANNFEKVDLEDVKKKATQMMQDKLVFMKKQK